MIKSRASRNEYGEPVVTFKAVAIHDVMRWAIHMLGGQVEFSDIGAKTLQSLRGQVGVETFDAYLARLCGGRDNKHFEWIRGCSIRRRAK